MIFHSLELHDWRQFADVRVDFHPRLTILTGANGAGKTTILNLLSRHFGWQGTMVSTPYGNRLGARQTTYSSGGRVDWFIDRLARLIEALRNSQDSEAKGEDVTETLADLAPPFYSSPIGVDASLSTQPDVDILASFFSILPSEDINLIRTMLGRGIQVRLAEGWQRANRFDIDSAARRVLSLTQQPQVRVGSIQYANDTHTTLFVPGTVGSTFQVEFSAIQQVQGLHIPSHRPIYSYQPVQNIPAIPKKREQLFAEYVNIVRERYYGGHTGRTPNHFLKETLIALATFGLGNEVVKSDPASLAMFYRFQEILREVLPPTFGFNRIAVRIPEVVLETSTGDVSVDAVSGGISSLIDIAWQIFTYAGPDEEFVVTIDEPENHLHPELQRTILASLVRAFPRVQFVCSTHNPFIVTSVPESAVFVLRYDGDHRVFSEPLDSIDRSGSSNEVLRDVLGLESTSPVWVDKILESIQASLSDRELNESTLAELRARLTSAGLERFTPPILANLIRRHRDDQTPS